MVLISIEGLIGAGKSEFCRILAENDDIKFVVRTEPVVDWNVSDEDGTSFNVLKEFYKNPKKYACMFQTLVLRTRVEQAQNIKHGFVERCILSDRMFGAVQKLLGNMNAIEYATYYYQFKQAVRDTPDIHGHIYIRTSVKTCLERIDKRKREGEEGIQEDYLNMLQTQHEKWLNKPEDPKILIIDGENDFRSEEAAKDVIEKVKLFVLQICKHHKKS